jgi:hypothetical protein
LLLPLPPLLSACATSRELLLLAAASAAAAAAAPLPSSQDLYWAAMPGTDILVLAELCGSKAGCGGQAGEVEMAAVVLLLRSSFCSHTTAGCAATQSHNM